MARLFLILTVTVFVSLTAATSSAVAASGYVDERVPVGREGQFDQIHLNILDPGDYWFENLDGGTLVSFDGGGAGFHEHAFMPMGPGSEPWTTWYQGYNDATSVIATGDMTTGGLSFWVQFADDLAYLFNVQTYSQGQLTGSWNIFKEAGGWWSTPAGDSHVQTIQIPEPGTILIAGLGLAVVGSMAKRRPARVQ